MYAEMKKNHCKRNITWKDKWKEPWNGEWKEKNENRMKVEYKETTKVE